MCVCVYHREGREGERGGERACTAGHRAFFPLSFSDLNGLMEHQDFFFLIFNEMFRMTASEN